MSSLEKALALVALGFSVFPASPTTKVGLTEHGHLDSSSDPETVATWFSGEFANAVVGVHAGESEVIFLDVDVRDNTDGNRALGFLEIPETFSYFTRSGAGKHYVYDFSTPLPPSNKYRGMQGVDRKSGSSFCIWWGDEVPSTRDELAMPPDWLLDYTEATTNFIEGFAGDVSDWLEQLPEGEPTETVRQIVENLPTDNFNHQDVISLTYRLVRLGAEGHTGIPWAFDTLWSTWVKPPYDGLAEQRELLNAISGAVRKAGAEDHALSLLPSYGDAMDEASGTLLDILISGEPGKASYFSAIKQGVIEHLSAETIAALIWSAPSTKLIARDWSIGFLTERIAEEFAKYSNDEDYVAPPVVEQESSVDANVSLLTDAERKLIQNHATIIERYIDEAGSRVEMQNRPYDEINAWTYASAVFCDSGFVPRKNGKRPLNFFTSTIGDTTTGKTESKNFLMSTLHEAFLHDATYNIGGNGSPNALSEKLVERDGKPSFFNKDEAHGALKIWTDPKNWAAGLLEDLAEYYDGKVPPHLFKGSKETSGKSAVTYFLIHLMGTPDAMMQVLSRELFLTGFLARMQWAIGEPRQVSYESMAEEDSDGTDIKLGFDPFARQMATEVAIAKRILKVRTGNSQNAVRIQQDAAKRLQDAKWALSTTFVNDRNWDILEPSLVRMGVTIRKAASLLAMSEARDYIVLNDVLLAIQAAEVWVNNLVKIASQISGSEFARACDEIETFIESKGGEVRRELVVRRFKNVETRVLASYIGSLIEQGRIRDFHTDRQRYLAVEKGA